MNIEIEKARARLADANARMNKIKEHQEEVFKKMRPLEAMIEASDAEARKVGNDYKLAFDNLNTLDPDGALDFSLNLLRS